MARRFRRSTRIRSIVVAAALAAIAACGSGNRATSPPTTAAAPTTVPTAVWTATATGEVVPTTAPSGSSLYRTDAFDVGLSLTLPAGWKIGVDEPGMFTAYLLTTGDIPDVGVDVQIVPVVHKDPCDPNSGIVPQGYSASALAAWMLAFEPLAATAGAPTSVDGYPALVVDEAFNGTPCLNPVLWSTPGGRIDQTEQKRFFIFNAAGRRLVGTIFSPDARFASHVDAALGVLHSVRLFR